MDDFFERVAALRREHRAFAIATVVARRPPVSAHLGDHAIVFADGRMEGFVGGACTRDIVRQQALAAIAARRGRLVSIRPDEGSESSPDHVVVTMTCASEGAVDVFVEPFVRVRSLVVVGATPVAEALARLARSMDYDVARVVDAPERRDVEPGAAALGIRVVSLDDLAGAGRELPPDAAVVASQGHYDEEALEMLLRAGVPYVGLVASRKRGATVRVLLEQRGVPDVAAMRSPAGLDLGGRAPAEVALSILAEIVQAQPSHAATARTATGDDCRRPDLRDERRRRIGPPDRRDRRRGVLLLLRPVPHEVPRGAAGIPGPPMTNAAALHDRFRDRGFIVSEAFATALQIMLALEKPLLLEGPAGVGKTESAKVLADVLGTELIRLQCYEGLDSMSALYEWNYPRQMLHARLSETDGSSLEAREAVLFSERFLLKRPLLDAITRDRPPVLLIDEVDRADEAFEAFLLEVLAEWQVTIPELGTIRARHRPHVIVTSNRSRELSDALRRRCLFLWLPYPSLAQEIEVLHARVPGLSERLAQQIARLMEVLRSLPLQKAPGVAESLDWAMALMSLHRDHLDAAAFAQTLGCVLKVHEDHAVLHDHDRELAPILDGPGPLESGGYSLGTDFGFGSVSAPRG